MLRALQKGDEITLTAASQEKVVFLQHGEDSGDERNSLQGPRTPESSVCKVAFIFKLNQHQGPNVSIS